MKEETVIHLNKILYLKWSEYCWKAGKKGESWNQIKREINKLFREIK